MFSLINLDNPIRSSIVFYFIILTLLFVFKPNLFEYKDGKGKCALPILILMCAFLIVLLSNRIQRSIIWFVKKFYKKPVNEIKLSLYSEGIIILLPMTIVVLLVLMYPIKEYKVEYEFAQQIEKLDEMQSSLEDLQILISTQKERLIQTERYIEILKTEKEKLEPIVKANRELVESILTLQKGRTIFQVWKDRFIGFLISLLAGLVIIKFRNILKYKKP